MSSWNRIQVSAVCMLFGLTILALPAAAEDPKPTTSQPRRQKLPEGINVERDLAYDSHGKSNTLDLYLPEKATAPLPLVIWIHGGAWIAGNKDDGGPAIRLLPFGYATASINYRLSNEAIYPAQIEDCKAAMRFLRANAKKYNLDPDHFGVWGASAGGHLVALLGTTGDVKELEGSGPHLDVSSRVQAVCDLFGPTDLAKIASQSGPEIVMKHDAPDSPEAKLIGGPIQDNPEKAAKANPITYVSKSAAPFLILHGDKDPLVPAEQSRILHEALQKAGVESTLVIVKGAGHGPGLDTPQYFQQVVDFFDRHLRTEKPTSGDQSVK
ncbi:MAG TPA: alpha/beta hydrolase [Pirellulales bacterium]|nr:alpha/beta hydrolase [Pirellulales bacterium]